MWAAPVEGVQVTEEQFALGCRGEPPATTDRKIARPKRLVEDLILSRILV